MDPTPNCAFVLVRPKNAGNIGAAARALANMGFSDLRLVAPDGSRDRTASELAAHGREVLAHAPIYPSLEAALADRTLCYATTCRAGSYRSAPQELRAAAREIVGLGQAVAVVFGTEDSGLSNDDLKHCQRLITIPTAPAYRSINLAQSVMLAAYELFMAERAEVATPASGAANHPAGVAEAGQMLQRLERALMEIGFVADDTSERIMFALRRMLGRAGLSQRELDILNGIARQIDWYGREGHTVLEAKRRAGLRVR